MAYDGYLTFAGTEIVNRARLNAYVSAFMPGLLRDSCECPCDDLPAAVGDHGYSTPFGDQAPWVDEDDPATGQFYGVMVNSMRGIDDSSRVVSYDEAIRDGGAQVGGREGVKEVRFVMTAFAGSEAAMESGWRWLKSALKGECSKETAVGADLCFFSSCPEVGTPVGAQIITRLLGNNMVPERGLWDGETFIPNPGTTLLTEAPEGFFYAEGLTEGPEGFYSGLPESNVYTGFYGIQPAYLSTPWMDRPIACGEAYWEFVVSGQGAIRIEAVVDGTVVSSTDVELTEESQSITVTEGGYANPNSRALARIVGADGSEITLHEAREVRHETPEVGDDCSDDYLRILRDVFVIQGPKVRSDNEVRGGVIREFEFVAAAMTPHIFGVDREVATMYRGWTRARRGVTIGTWSGPLAACDPVDHSPLLDPYCEPLAPLPSVPSIPLGCGGISAADWNAAYLIEIPDRMLQEWVDTVPILSFRTEEEVRGVRARFFPRPDPDWSMANVDPCSACGTFEISYIPQNATMTIDGTTKRIVAELPGGRTQIASHLVSSGDNDAAFTWPELSCGIGYFLLIETAGASVDGLSLRLAAKE